MKKIIYLLTILLSGIFILLIPPSCTKTVTKTVTDSLLHAWRPIDGFNLSFTQELNSIALGDTQLVVAGTGRYIMAPVNHSSFNYFYNVLFPGTSAYSPANGTPFLNGSLCSYTTPTSLFITSVPQYFQYSTISYTPVYSDSSYSRFQQPSPFPHSSYPAAAYPVIRNKYVLTPVETYINDRGKARFDLLSFDSAKVLSPTGFGDTFAVKKIYLTPNPNTIGFGASGYFCAAWYNKFFVYYESQFYRIDTAGNIKSFGYLPAPYTYGYGVYNMFTRGNTLFVNSSGILFSSTDQGETWTLFNDLSNTAAGRVVFRNVGSDLYATIPDNDSQIWKVAFAGNNLNFSELNNDGLETNVITSITPCGKYIFITTFSGVFYREKTLFDQLKTPVR